MKLNSRQAQTLRMLSRSAEGFELSDLADTFKVSRRTVYYDISAINRYLDIEDVGSLKVANRRIDGSGVRWDEVERLSISGGGILCFLCQRTPDDYASSYSAFNQTGGHFQTYGTIWNQPQYRSR